MKLATKISVTLVGVLAVAVLSSAVILFSTSQVADLMESIVTENLASVRAAEELEIALLEQKGFVSSYILDRGNPAWLEELNRRKPAFARLLARARETARTSEEQEIIARITEVYRTYDTIRSEAIVLHQRGSAEEAKRVLLEDLKILYHRAYILCEDLIAANERFIASAVEDGRRRIRQNTLIAGSGAVLTCGLSLGLLWLFFRGVLRPLRRMAEDARVFTARDKASKYPGFPQDELRAVAFYLRTLMSDVAETRDSLEKSRSQLLNAEKLALVGKLAASVAHEIRNPLTSLKMHLFSIQEELEEDYGDDLQVVSEEISRLENIIHNFLEFSRPPALNLQPHSVWLLIDKTLELVRRRIQEENIELIFEHRRDLPPVLADSEQIRQVFLNLLVNAGEAIENGGRIRISAALEPDSENRKMVVVRFQDSGSGIPEEARDRIFEPFFSTKENGTGLGLCIAAQILAGHGGFLELETSTGQGTSFAVWIPAVPEDGNG